MLFWRIKSKFFLKKMRYNGVYKKYQLLGGNQRYIGKKLILIIFFSLSLGKNRNAYLLNTFIILKISFSSLVRSLSRLFYLRRSSNPRSITNFFLFIRSSRRALQMSNSLNFISSSLGLSSSLNSISASSTKKKKQGRGR